jgi:hypothetical protein
MPTKIDAGGHGPGVESERASDLRDTRQGNYDPATNPPKENTSQTTPHERAQPGGAVQGEPVPDFSEDAELPEGLKREPKGPYSRTAGRGNSE